MLIPFIYLNEFTSHNTLHNYTATSLISTICNLHSFYWFQKFICIKIQFLQNRNKIYIFFLQIFIMFIFCHNNQISLVPFFYFRIIFQRIWYYKTDSILIILKYCIFFSLLSIAIPIRLSPADSAQKGSIVSFVNNDTMKPFFRKVCYSTVTLFAKFLGLSTSNPFATDT